MSKAVNLDINKLFIEPFLKDIPLEMGNDNEFILHNLIRVQSASSITMLRGVRGCYFIFTTIPPFEVPTYSNHQCYNKFIPAEEGNYRCLYVGVDSKNIESAVKGHLLSPNTIQASRPGLRRTICATGRIPLDGILQSEFQNLEANGAVKTKDVNYFKKVSKFDQTTLPQRLRNCARMANGIDVNEAHWKAFRFAVLAFDLGDACKFGYLINNLFQRLNGKPPLNDQDL